MKNEDLSRQHQPVFALNNPLYPNLPSISEHELAYRDFMKTVFSIAKQELISKLEKQSIGYYEDTFEDSFKIMAKSYIYNLQIIEVSINYACFSGHLSILNIDTESPIHSTCESSSGGYGNIFKLRANGELYAMKCIAYSENTFQSIFSNILMECFLLKIASALEVGPCMHSPFGFNLVIYRNCIELPMEFCQYSRGQYLESDLKAALQKMHALKIIHFDIKPENINYSSVYNKYIFIDFGLSKVISQQIGQKSWSLFRGSLVYCSAEMETAYFQSELRLIDLYFNDSECLRKSLINFQQRLQICEIQKNNQQQVTDMSSIYGLMGLKWRIYHISRQSTNQKQLLLIMKDPLIQKYLAEISQFISYLPSGLDIFVRFHDQLWSRTDRQRRTTRKMMAQLLKQEHFINDSQNDVFKQRFEQIRSLNLRSLTYNRTYNQQLQAKILKEIESSMNGSKEIYYLKALDVIRVEDNNFPMDLKLKVATQFITREIKTIKTQQSPIKMALLFLLQHFFSTVTTKYSIMIFQNTLNSLFFYEVITEQEALMILRRFFNTEMELANKLRLSFKFLMSIKWVEGKYQSIYDYHHLQNAILIQIKQFLLSLPQNNMDNKQRLYYDIVDSALFEPLKKSTQLQIYKIIEKHGVESILTLNKHFLNELYRFMSIREVEYHQYEGQSNCVCMQTCLKLAAENAKKCGISLCLFTSLHTINFYLRKDKLLELYLTDINKIAANYKQLKHYTIYVYYQLHRFSRNLLCQESIITLMGNVIKSGNYFIKLQLFSQLLRIYLAKQKEYEYEAFLMVKKVLKFTFLVSKQMIVFPKTLPNYQIHRHQLIKIVKNIIIIYNYIIGFSLIARDIIERWITDFIQSIQDLISSSQCLECKYLSLMFLSYLYTSRELMRQDYERAWNIMVDYSVQYIKTDTQTLSTLDALISFSFQFKNYRSFKPRLIAMFAEFVTEWGNYGYFFQREINGYQILREVYSYLLDNNMHNELIKLLQFSIIYIHSHSVKLYINTFFMAIFHLIEPIVKTQAGHQFYCKHAGIIDHFRKKGFNPYNGFYFFILMLSNYKQGHDSSLLYFIAKSINLLNAWCRQLIQNYYYQIFLYHKESPPRKHRYLNKIHQKCRFTDMKPISEFVKCFRKRKNKLQPRASKQLDQALKKLHGHIFEHKQLKENDSIYLQI